MERILPNPINEKKVTKTICIFMLIFCLAPIILNIICIAPIYSILYSDIQFQSTPLPEIIRYIMDFLDILAFTSSYALIIFSFILLKKKSTVLISVFYISILLFKIPLKLLMEQLLNHSITSTSQLWLNLNFSFFYFFIEILQFLIVFIVASTVSKHYLYSVDMLSSKKKRKTYKIEHILPFKKYIDRYNPLLRCALYSGIIVTIFRIITQLISDIELGAPESFKVTMIIIILYITSIIYGVITYLLSILIFNLFYKFVSSKKGKTDKTNENNESNENNEKNDKANEDDSLALPKD